jgi:hypothetical protein
LRERDETINELRTKKSSLERGRPKERASKRSRSSSSSGNKSPTGRHKKQGRKAETFDEFKKVPKGNRLREYRDWMETVNSSMNLARNYTEKDKANFFNVKCGPYLT